MSMDAGIKRRWVEALRSGRYRQTTGRLHDGEGYCCLGVLCDLKDPAVWVEKIDEDDENFVLTYEGSESELPAVVSDWAGLRYCNPDITLPGDGDDSTLADLNDSGWTFQQIADLIEEQL